MGVHSEVRLTNAAGIARLEQVLAKVAGRLARGATEDALVALGREH